MSIYSGVCRIYTPSHTVHLRYPWISVQQPTLLDDVLGGRDRARLEIHLDTDRSSELRDALGGTDRASLEIHVETERSSELRDALGGSD